MLLHLYDNDDETGPGKDRAAISELPALQRAIISKGISEYNKLNSKTPKPFPSHKTLIKQTKTTTFLCLGLRRFDLRNFCCDPHFLRTICQTFLLKS